MNIQIPEQTEYELKSYAMIMDGEWGYKTIEEREEVMKRLFYSITDAVVTILVNKYRKPLHFWENKENKNT